MNMFWLHETDTAINAHLAAEVTAGRVSVLTGWVTMTVTACSLDGTPAGDGRPLATLRALPIGGEVTFYNALQAVRNHMLQGGLSVARYRFAFTQEANSNTINPLSAAVLYCDWQLAPGHVSAAEYVRDHFLTAGDVSMRLTGDTFLISLPFFEPPSLEGDLVDYPLEGICLATTGRWPEGTLYFRSFYEAQRRDNGLFLLDDLPTFLDWTAHQLNVGRRNHRVYMLQAPERATVRLRFRNWFNALEDLALPAYLTRRPSTEKDEGLFGDTFQDWARDDTDEYTLVCDPLPAALCPAALSFARSRKPQVRFGQYGLLDVIVTGYEMEQPDAPGTTTRFECTFRLRDRKQLIIES